MFYLILAWTAGVVVRYLLVAASDPTFTVKSNSLKAIGAVVVGSVFSWAGEKANLTHWAVYALFVVGGFMTKYIIEKLTKIKG